MTTSFAGAGKAVGLEIWRIEKLQAVKLDPLNHGKFHTGDSYIILKSSTAKHAASGSGNGVAYAIHCW